ncbi:flagellar biosynthetic protein FliO [bacterium]|nr:flagellar biosynthetic protein FliO [bacterium]
MPATPAPAPPVWRPHPALIGGGVLVVALGFGLPRLFADSPGPAAAEPAAAPGGPGVGTALLKMGAAVVVAGGMCAIAARYAGQRAAADAGPLAVAAALRIDGRCVLHYVRAGDRRLLVGTDPGGVKALVELPRREPEEPEEPEAAPAAADAATVLFSRILAELPTNRLPTPHGGGL